MDAVYCCVLGARRAVDGLELALGSKNNCCVPPSPSPPTQLIVTSPDRPVLPRSSNESNRAGQEPIVSLVPPPDTSCAEEQHEPTIAPSSCCRGGCFVTPTAKLTALRATEARGGISDDVGWLLWPSSDDSEAIGHGFGGRSMVDWCVVCEKYRTFVRSSQKNEVSAQLTFFNCSLSDEEVSFVKKYLYVICRA